MGVFRVKNQVILAWFSTLLAFVGFVPERVMKLRDDVYWPSFMSNNYKSTQKRMFESFGKKSSSFLLVYKFGEFSCQ